MNQSTLKDRLERALEGIPEPKPTQADLARAAKVKPPSVSDWFNGRTKSLRGEPLLAVAKALGVSPLWLNTGRGPMRPGGGASDYAYRLVQPEEFGGATDEIPLLDARGSCGGGAVMWEMEAREPLVKEAKWFTRYNVRPEDLVAVFADGDSMAEFIVDGDIVIFDQRKTDPKSGVIFLIDHPDGLKIKRMRREIDGTWVLESLNSDKRRYPDERITPDQADLLRIRGQFVYRQGG
jgi:phage repressor protein C with HTH and peptisase S24 domain